MTGLNPEVDELVEVAVIVTDFALTPLDPGIDLIIKPNQAALDQMDDFVRTMHTTSGLIEEIPSGLEIGTAEQRILEYIDRFVPADKQAPLAGNTIGTDRMFLNRYMPTLDGRLHYRNVDVSSIKELARRWFPRIYFNAPEKHGGHRALADIRESIRELDYYRRVAFVTDPGPDSETVKKASVAVVDEWAPRM